MLACHLSLNYVQILSVVLIITILRFIKGKPLESGSYISFYKELPKHLNQKFHENPSKLTLSN